MANEYRVYQIAAEVVSTGNPLAPVRLYHYTAEVIRSIANAPPSGGGRRRNFMNFTP